MISCLNLKRTDKILEVGTGTGWQTAILSYLCKEVFTIERFELLLKKAKKNIDKVRRQIRKYSLNIELKDAKNNVIHKEELIIGGGKHKVPCLRIDHSEKHTEWLYESDKIISYLKKEIQLS